jgi:hypothetical protein
LNFAVPDAVLFWVEPNAPGGHLRTSTFAPHSSVEGWRYRVMAVAESGRFDQMKQVSRAMFDKVAALIERDTTSPIVQ